MVHKVDLQAAARTCSQATRDPLSHGVLPYGASLVGAGVREGNSLPGARRVPVSLRVSSRAVSTPRPRTAYASTLRHRLRHASVVQYAVLLMSETWQAPNMACPRESEWKCTRRRVWCGYPQVTLSETLFPSIECSWKDKGTFCVT